MPPERPAVPTVPVPAPPAGAPPGEGREGDLDEVGFAIGPDEGGGGLFDRSGTDATGTGEATASTSRPDLAVTAQRTALLAWLAADLPSVEAPEESTEPGFQPPPELAELPEAAMGKLAAELRRALADEPLDPLPSLDGIGGGVWPELAPVGGRGDTVGLAESTVIPDESSTTALLSPVVLAAVTGPPAPAPPAPESPAVPASAPPSALRPRGLGGLDALVAVILSALALAYLFAGR